jgi:IS1 family transposase/transposase-like protein
VECPNKCNSKPYIHGRYGKQNTPRFKCPRCGRTFSQTKKVCDSLNIPAETVYRVLACLTEGCGVRATARLNNVSAETVLKILRIAGEKAESILDRKLRNVRANLVQIDEAWTFVQKKQRAVRPDDHPDHGDQWCFLAITEHKLITTYTLGKRDPQTAVEFISSLRDRVSGRFQLTSDGWRVYLPIIEDVFGADIDYGWEIKDYGQAEESRERYSPSKLKAVKREVVSGRPNPDLITTAHIERGNLTLRTRMRRLTRLASGFSKKKAYLAAALALHIFAYDFLTVHSSIRSTPAQASGIAENVWTWADLFAS